MLQLELFQVKQKDHKLKFFHFQMKFFLEVRYLASFDKVLVEASRLAYHDFLKNLFYYKNLYLGFQKFFKNKKYLKYLQY